MAKKSATTKSWTTPEPNPDLALDVAIARLTADIERAEELVRQRSARAHRAD